MEGRHLFLTIVIVLSFVFLLKIVNAQVCNQGSHYACGDCASLGSPSGWYFVCNGAGTGSGQNCFDCYNPNNFAGVKCCSTTDTCIGSSYGSWPCQAQQCQDSDGGDSPGYYGTCTDSSGTHPDSCISSTQQKEWSCSVSACIYSTHDCNQICSDNKQGLGQCTNGVCVCSPPTPKVSVDKSSYNCNDQVTVTFSGFTPNDYLGAAVQDAGGNAYTYSGAISSDSTGSGSFSFSASFYTAGTATLYLQDSHGNPATTTFTMNTACTIPTTTTPPNPTTTTNPPGSTTTTTSGGSTTTVPGGSTTTTTSGGSTTTTTTIPPLPIICNSCYANSECICKVDNCNDGIWAAKNSNGHPLDENKFQLIPPAIFNFTPMDTGKVEVRVVCNNPANGNNTIVVVNKQFLICPNECSVNQPCTCSVNGCSDGKFTSIQVNSVLLVKDIKTVDFSASFIPLNSKEINVSVTCEDPHKYDMRLVYVKGEVPPPGQDFKASNFHCDSVGSSYRCTTDYENNVGENVVVVFTLSQSPDGSVVGLKEVIVSSGKGTTSPVSFSCDSLSGTGYVAWKAYKTSDRRNPIAWSKSDQRETLTC